MYLNTLLGGSHIINMTFKNIKHSETLSSFTEKFAELNNTMELLTTAGHIQKSHFIKFQKFLQFLSATYLLFCNLTPF